MKRKAKLKTTVGELIYALSEETGKVIRDEKTKCRVVAYMLRELLDASRERRAEALRFTRQILGVSAHSSLGQKIKSA